MNQLNTYPTYWTSQKKEPIETLLKTLEKWKKDGDKIVTTNGCFDLLHSGHVAYLQNAKELGQRLIVGLNSNRSASKIKGTGKPIMDEVDRAVMLSALRSVDAVVVFDDLLPNRFLEIVKPDIHCKAGDYTAESLPEAEIVKKLGGKVTILPLLEGISTTRVIERIISGKGVDQEYNDPVSGELSQINRSDEILTYMLDSSNLFRQTAYQLKMEIEKSLELIVNTLKQGNKLFLCGNGGSAADAQHIAAEFVGRFKLERNALPAMALTTDTSILTAISNDYGFEEIFARQLAAHGSKGDLLIAISTSGRSANILKAADEALKRGINVIGLTGRNGTALDKKSTITLKVPSEDTPLIQQIHIGILHLLCDLCEKQIFNHSK